MGLVIRSLHPTIQMQRRMCLPSKRAETKAFVMKFACIRRNSAAMHTTVITPAALHVSKIGLGFLLGKR